MKYTATGKDEKDRIFINNQLGAVLVCDEFEEYHRIKYVSEVLAKLGTEQYLIEVAPEPFDASKAQLQRVCDVMADLGLYEVMMLKCREFAEETEEEPVEKQHYLCQHENCQCFSRRPTVTVRLKKQCSRRMAAKWRSQRNSRKTGSDKEEVIKKLKVHLQLGIATQLLGCKEEKSESPAGYPRFGRRRQGEKYVGSHAQETS